MYEYYDTKLVLWSCYIWCCKLFESHIIFNSQRSHSALALTVRETLPNDAPRVIPATDNNFIELLIVTRADGGAQRHVNVAVTLCTCVCTYSGSKPRHYRTKLHVTCACVSGRLRWVTHLELELDVVFRVHRSPRDVRRVRVVGRRVHLQPRAYSISHASLYSTTSWCINHCVPRFISLNVLTRLVSEFIVCV